MNVQNALVAWLTSRLTIAWASLAGLGIGTGEYLQAIPQKEAGAVGIAIAGLLNLTVLTLYVIKWYDNRKEAKERWEEEKKQMRLDNELKELKIKEVIYEQAQIREECRKCLHEKNRLHSN